MQKILVKTTKTVTEFHEVYAQDFLEAANIVLTGNFDENDHTTEVHSRIEIDGMEETVSKYTLLFQRYEGTDVVDKDQVEIYAANGNKAMELARRLKPRLEQFQVDGLFVDGLEVFNHTKSAKI